MIMIFTFFEGGVSKRQSRKAVRGCPPGFAAALRRRAPSHQADPMCGARLQGETARFATNRLAQIKRNVGSKPSRRVFAADHWFGRQLAPQRRTWPRSTYNQSASFARLQFWRRPQAHATSRSLQSAQRNDLQFWCRVCRFCADEFGQFPRARPNVEGAHHAAGIAV